MTLVDSSVWSLALRRNPASLNEKERSVVNAWMELANAEQAALVGIIRHEVLSGVSNSNRFKRLKLQLSKAPYLPTHAEAHDLAATFFNHCRAKGITASIADILICASARVHRVPIFTTDRDFERIAPLVDIELWKVTLN